MPRFTVSGIVIKHYRCNSIFNIDNSDLRRPILNHFEDIIDMWLFHSDLLTRLFHVLDMGNCYICKCLVHTAIQKAHFNGVV